MLLALLFVVKNKVVGSRANAIFGKYTTLASWKFYGKRKLLCATSLAAFLYVNSLCLPITASRNCINPQGKISIPYPRGHNTFYEAYHCKCITKTFFNKM